MSCLQQPSSSTMSAENSFASTTFVGIISSNAYPATMPITNFTHTIGIIKYAFEGVASNIGIVSSDVAR